MREKEGGKGKKEREREGGRSRGGDLRGRSALRLV
jgi:hypothetical protein